MKKLLVFVALIGMGAYLAGCGETTPPAKAPPAAPAGGAMPPAGGVKPGPKEGDKEMPEEGSADKGDSGKGEPETKEDGGDKEEK